MKELKKKLRTMVQGQTEMKGILDKHSDSDWYKSKVSTADNPFHLNKRVYDIVLSFKAKFCGFESYLYHLLAV